MSEAATAYTEQPAAPPAAGQSEPPIVFLGIGVVINLILITAYFVWAYKQVKKRNQTED